MKLTTLIPLFSLYTIGVLIIPMAAGGGSIDTAPNAAAPIAKRGATLAGQRGPGGPPNGGASLQHANGVNKGGNAPGAPAGNPGRFNKPQRREAEPEWSQGGQPGGMPSGGNMPTANFGGQGSPQGGNMGSVKQAQEADPEPVYMDGVFADMNHLSDVSYDEAFAMNTGETQYGYGVEPEYEKREDAAEPGWGGQGGQQGGDLGGMMQDGGGAGGKSTGGPLGGMMGVPSGPGGMQGGGAQWKREANPEAYPEPGRGGQQGGPAGRMPGRIQGGQGGKMGGMMSDAVFSGQQKRNDGEVDGEEDGEVYYDAADVVADGVDGEEVTEHESENEKREAEPGWGSQQGGDSGFMQGSQSGGMPGGMKGAAPGGFGGGQH